MKVGWVWPVALALTAALVLALLNREPAVLVPAAEDPDEALEFLAEIDALQAALADEIFARELLEVEVELMRAVLEELTNVEPEHVSGDEIDDEAASSEEDMQVTESERFDQALLGFGFVASELQELRDRWDQTRLAKLELIDRAMREGWTHRPRHRHQLDQIDARLRQQLGEDGYDRMLIATRQPNRVLVHSVLRGSVAAAAGIQVGDRLVEYGGVRIFSPNDVRKATTSGVKGESARMRVERHGGQISFVVPRGPLGVQMSVGKSPQR